MDLVLLDGDEAIFNPAFGAAVVTVKPGVLKASGAVDLNGKKVCLAGDEQSVRVPGCLYITTQHSIPGTGTLKIEALAANQKAQRTQDKGKKLLLKGGVFQATFEVQTPAQHPAPPGRPIPDATRRYSGQGSFLTSNKVFEAS